MDTAPYYVWKRIDGYVDATRYAPVADKASFEILLVTSDWAEAKELIKAERDTDEHRALMASWDVSN